MNFFEFGVRQFRGYRTAANKVKRLAPSFGGGSRFIPEKYKQSIVEIYTFLSFKKKDRSFSPVIRCVSSPDGNR